MVFLRDLKVNYCYILLRYQGFIQPLLIINTHRAGLFTNPETYGHPTMHSFLPQILRDIRLKRYVYRC